ncbi:MAG: anthranilate phosphoribosyltransferase [Candidatus Nanopelagicales bacterium]
MTAHGWPSLLDDLLTGRDMSADQGRWAMDQVMSGAAAPAQIAAFLVALRAKGVTGAELAVLVDVMLDHSVSLDLPQPSVDTCGTGGDNSGSVNISTMAAVVVAASGRRVVKHGNRAASSQAGSADVLEALGVVADLPPDEIADCLQRAGIVFCFAPVFHPALRHAGPVRRELGIRTVFNFLGPLANPARPVAQVVGVADLGMAPVVAGALAARGTRALVFRGEDGMDEITTLGPTRVWDARTAAVTESVIDTVDLGIARPASGALDGADAAHNASVARAVLSGAGSDAVRDAVAVNAAAAMAVFDVAAGTADAAEDLPTQLTPRIAEALAVIRDGRAAATLDGWVAASRGPEDDAPAR